MNFTRINIEQWERKEYFEHYFSDVPCTYSMTVKLDITRIKMKERRLYPAMLHLLTTVVNEYDEFRTAVNQNGELGIYREMIPCYTIFHEDTETFSNIWTQYFPEYEDFCHAYEQDLFRYGDRKGMEAKPNVPENSFPVSMIPWTSFEGFHINLQNGYQYFLPIFTMGKYSKEGEKFFLPLSVQVHHAVCDGFHVCRFINRLRELIDQI